MKQKGFYMRQFCVMSTDPPNNFTGFYFFPDGGHFKDVKDVLFLGDEKCSSLRI